MLIIRRIVCQKEKGSGSAMNLEFLAGKTNALSAGLPCGGSEPFDS
jgi:hypothetical protein